MNALEQNKTPPFREFPKTNLNAEGLIIGTFAYFNGICRLRFL